MFPSWLSDGFNNALNGAGEAFNNFIYGNPKPSETPTEKPQEVAVEEPSQESLQPELPSVVDPAEPARVLRKGESLADELYLLQMEATEYAEKKTKDAYAKLKNSFESNKALANLLQTITNLSDQNGSFDAKDDETKKMLTAARSAGVKIPEGKTSFTKDERDSLIRNIELQKTNIELEIRLNTNAAQESIQQRNVWFQELKSVHDKISSAIKKCTDNVR